MARSKEFDYEDVLGKAMGVFWEQGYEHTSIQDLVDAMSIHRRSIYDTYGDKHALFIKTLNLYEKKVVENLQLKIKPEMSVHKKLEIIFLTPIGEGNQQFGCLVINTTLELAKINPIISNRVTEILEREEAQIYNILLLAKERGEIEINFDLDGMTAFLHNALVGIRVLAKTTERKKLDKVVEQTLSFVK